MQLHLLFAALDNGTPICEIMRANERVAGRRVVRPGEEPWLSTEDWLPSVTVAVDEGMVRLVAIMAKAPGKGALRRTIQGIEWLRV